MNPGITIFLIATGENPNLPACMAALKAQTLPCPIEVVWGYAPMSRAFQEMNDRCVTPYYVQVDEDMILRPNAVELMHAAIIAAVPSVPFVCFELNDPHLSMDIFGVKIYRHDIMKRFPYNLSALSCEREQMDRLEAAGYRHELRFEVIGEHSPQWNDELIFERYYDLVEKWKKHRYLWMEGLPARLTQRMLEEPTKENYYAAMGATIAMQSSQTRNEEKNFQMKSIEYLKLKSLNCKPLQATLYLTSRCNFTCPMCSRQSSNRPEPAHDADIALVQSFVKKFPTVEGLCICGYGEPFMAPTLPWIVQWLKQNTRITVSIISNGSMIADSIATFASHDIAPDFVSVSLNAVDEAQHALQTGIPGQWEKVLQGIEAALRSGWKTYLTYIATTNNMYLVPKFLALAKSLGVHGVYIHNLLPHCTETTQEKHAFLSQVLTTEHRASIESLKTSPGAELVQKWPILVESEIERRNCQFPFISIAVDGRGYISTCNSIEPVRKGNAHLNDNAIWQGDYAQRMRLRFADKELPFQCRWCFRNYERIETP